MVNRQGGVCNKASAGKRIIGDSRARRASDFFVIRLDKISPETGHPALQTVERCERQDYESRSQLPEILQNVRPVQLHQVFRSVHSSQMPEEHKSHGLLLLLELYEAAVGGGQCEIGRQIANLWLSKFSVRQISFPLRRSADCPCSRPAARSNTAKKDLGDTRARRMDCSLDPVNQRIDLVNERRYRNRFCAQGVESGSESSAARSDYGDLLDDERGQ